MENCCGEGCVVCPFSYPVDEAVGAFAEDHRRDMEDPEYAATFAAELSSHCSSSCRTGGHQSWGECVRAKGLKVGWAASATDPGMDASFQKRNDRELDLYAATRRQGIQPDNTSTKAIHRAIEASDKAGSPYVSRV